MNFPVFFFHGAYNSCGVLSWSFVLNEQKTDNSGRILILDITLDVDQYISINLYNANTETEQVKILEELQSLLKNLDSSQNKRIIFAGDFNIFFNAKLEAKGGKPLLKRKFIIKLAEIKESLDICDIWRIRNPNTWNFTFRQNHSSGFIEHWLDYILILNCLQEFVNNTDILFAISTDHSPYFISLLSDKSDRNGNGFWKFNNSLVHVKKMKKKILKELIIQTNLWKTPKQSVNLKKKKFENSLMIIQKTLLKKGKNRGLI